MEEQCGADWRKLDNRTESRFFTRRLPLYKKIESLSNKRVRRRIPDDVGCMTAKGVGYACQIFGGNMNSQTYTNILGTTYKDTLDYYDWKHKDVIFQHDDDPKHTPKHTKRWMKRKGVQLLQDWPAQSPGLNPIEHLWRHLKHKLHSYNNRAVNVDELWQRVCKEWVSFTPGDVESYYRSMPKRIKAVIKAGGGSIKY
ncbi:hypothetical protein G6F43_013266 [Rhizopus delemar]|nr:hypothetical protein G6F43_013266 [Rhizopus delemar]